MMVIAASLVWLGRPCETGLKVAWVALQGSAQGAVDCLPLAFGEDQLP